MSLIAYRASDGADIESFSVSTTEWDTMAQENRINPPGTYRMYGTHAPVIFKRSLRGLQFFAHWPHTSDHFSKPKSEQHYLAQIGIVQALRNAGFHAQLEYRGTSDGEAWQADVYCEALGRRIVFEIQLTQQPLQEYQERTARYHHAGMKCVWLIRSPGHFFAFRRALIARGLVPYSLITQGVKWPGVQALPALPLDVGNPRAPSINDMKVTVFDCDGNAPQISVTAFATGVANGRLRFSRNQWLWDRSQ